MTVYELIQKLSQHPPNREVEVARLMRTGGLKDDAEVDSCNCWTLNDPRCVLIVAVKKGK